MYAKVGSSLWRGIGALFIASTLGSCSAGGDAFAIDADLFDAISPNDASGDVALPDAEPPEDLCGSDADCPPNQRCEYVNDGEFSRFICVCNTAPELCDGIDNDCDPATLDGAEEEGIREPCDGDDADLCTDGRLVCADARLYCDDDAESIADICDGEDNDCNPETPDGADDEGFGAPCDGADSDLCEDGAIACVDGAMGCDDDEAGVADICDGADNDCNPATADGADEPTLGAGCDGDDTDLCEAGMIICETGALTCWDVGGPMPDICDGIDNDCDPSTPDGSAETSLGTPCDGVDTDLCPEGTIICDGGALACTDRTTDDRDSCDGVDNDCNPATADGADEATLGVRCDGVDSDLCLEGAIACAGGMLGCTDTTGDDLDTCDGVDNDCNPFTADGAAEPTLGVACDGVDSDLCAEGMIICAAGALSCDDVTGDANDLCDGVDNDCNPATPDGAAEPTLGTLCDGADSDSCLEGEIICAAGALSCNDETGSTRDLCDGIDNDCNPSTADGSGEPSLGDACDGMDLDLCEGGAVVCTSGSLACTDSAASEADICDGLDNDCNPATPDGMAEATLGDACDGPDSDVCVEGTMVCSAGGMSCSDTTSSTPDICDGIDNDCDPATPDGSAEASLGAPCDGPDSDACVEGNMICSGGAMSCSDTTSSTPDICDGADNDCNPATPDGSAEATLGDACDGPDSDFCLEGARVCSGGAMTCSDTTGSTVDVCDGTDNDCNPATADGAAEATLGDACDGPDSDLCVEGSVVCSGGAMSCSDTTSSTPDICDGTDNDCNPATADGAAEATLGDACDGPDSDLCLEGSRVCVGGAMGCSDTTGSTPDICDGTDNDCNAATADGAAEATLGDACDGPDRDLCLEGARVCAGGAMSCSDATSSTVDLCDGMDNDCNPATADGSAEPSLGDACDGPDSDFCLEGAMLCSAGSMSCSDTTSSTVDVCDGIDNDCNPATADGSGSSCSAVPGCAGMCVSGGCDYSLCSEVVVFPNVGDSRVASADIYFWRAGDFVQGTRTTSLGSIRSIDMNLEVSPNLLSCDTQDHSFSVNGTVVGTFSISSTDAVISRSFSFGAIAGPTYTFRIETTRTVASGCGSAGFPEGSSTLTLRP